MIVHCCMDVRGALKMTQRQLGAMFRHSDGRRLSADRARDVLLDHVAAGHEVIPLGPVCQGFDYKTGCPGHETEPQA
ncbi:hypothetical protein B0E46_15615 [Rhodanobacter sp. B04]|uniref:hypothetical protein n=1 Tax=Rhodanobacter sp. B04 TaxID=1945860 RepID=UPI0009CCBBA7|nr:hypothetical protein [Rhodanobacter sp. B04]OOG61405.1 hypothetical protein B0E46_15615 [Rhodanobacter sp. B04]